jgi:hypothetical protein
MSFPSRYKWIATKRAVSSRASGTRGPSLRAHVVRFFEPFKPEYSFFGILKNDFQFCTKLSFRPCPARCPIICPTDNSGIFARRKCSVPSQDAPQIRASARHNCHDQPDRSEKSVTPVTRFSLLPSAFGPLTFREPASNYSEGSAQNPIDRFRVSPVLLL